MADIAALTDLIEPEVESLGYALVRVAMTGGGSDPTLQIMAERPDTRQLDLSDCEKISRRLSEKLDALEAEGRDPIEGGYRLEVSSPGIDRPLTRRNDYRDWAGHEARVTLAEKKNGRQQYSGTVQGIEGDTVTLAGKDGQAYEIAFTDIGSAKLLLTDKLIKSTAPISTEGADTIQEVEED
ncbi:ribosome maturation protein RimP [Sphingomonas piscis]|uniref:Ribosome maturation factor RimP n=1 Tax=Sphingomonas piscis TaxID=2714943 RepID=A0A6G7YNC3_9SPHN|nr:ribosome maturation protein RimP [Sphingomonas piscis]QIK78239.1 ribosome maturation protein RimP [Sphingomonas piscis]